MKTGFSMLPHPLSNFEIQRCCQNKLQFKVLSSRNYIPNNKLNYFSNRKFSAGTRQSAVHM